jgi:hypothetical protein
MIFIINMADLHHLKPVICCTSLLIKHYEPDTTIPINHELADF